MGVVLGVVGHIIWWMMNLHIYTRYPFPLEWAKDKLTMGSEKKGKVFDAQTLRNTAYHEAGHTLVAYFTEVREMSFQQLNRLTDRPTNRQTD